MATFREQAHFLKNAIFDPKVAALTISSPYMVNRVLKHITKPLDLIIEYGPGQGIMTRALLSHLSPCGKFIVIESNKEFVETLRRIRDSRIEIIEGNVQDVIPVLKECGIFDVDLVVSSIPFSFIKSSDRTKIVKDTYDFLAPKGSFIIFHQYTPLMYKPLKQLFAYVTLAFEPRNILPCFIIQAKKNNKT